LSRSFFRLLVTVVLCSVTGCKAFNPPPSIATIGGRQSGRIIDHAPMPVRVQALTEEIRAVSARIDPDEAARCADCAVRYTRLLARYHHLTHWAEFNSLMVNVGLKKRGYCFQLADDLKAELLDQNYQTIVFTRAIAYWDQPFHEHNCIVVTAPGQPFEEGLVLDAWRNPGVLRFARVKLDAYPWIPRIVHKSPPTTQTAAAR
jgi:hypothetical protein